MDSPVRPTVFIDSPRLAKKLGVRSLTFATETFQWTGSFKFRAAYHVASSVQQTLLIAASSGNFGQALAFACSLLDKKSIIVMPRTSASVKVAAVASYGGVVDLIDVESVGRAERIGQLAREYPNAYVASAYDDPLVIQGNSSIGREIAAMGTPPDVVVAPVGGGGLTSGIIQGLQSAGSAITVVGAEPLLANDAARSMRTGKIVANEFEPQSLADGARTLSLGVHNWAIIEHGLSAIVEVPEQAIVDAIRTLFSEANLKSEPTGALSLAAVQHDPTRFADKRVCCVISGGNVDPSLYAKLIG